MASAARPSLTPREQEIVQGILDGCTNRAIATRLGIREQTVRNALTVVYEKFDVGSRLELARALAREQR